MKIGGGEFLNGDCLELMETLPAHSVDLLLADWPFATTALEWDRLLPFDQLWERIWHVCKPDAAIVLCSQQPFTTQLIASQMEWFRYNWVWVKERATGFANSHRMPLKAFEEVCVFYKSLPTYNPQNIIQTEEKTIKRGSSKKMGVYGNRDTFAGEYTSDKTNWPNGLLFFDQTLATNRGVKPWHPTQKPIAMFEYLIETYSNPGQLVLDNTAGGGTTAYAAENTGRRWICMEKDRDYYERATRELKAYITRNQRAKFA